MTDALTPPTEIETVLAGAIGNLLNHRNLIKHAQLIITNRDGVIEVLILPAGFRKHWHSPKYGTKNEMFRVYWGTADNRADDAGIVDVIELADKLEEVIAQMAKAIGLKAQS